MLSAESTVTIRKPIEDVYDFVAIGENERLWRPSVISIRLRSGTDGATGAVYEQFMSGPMGMKIPADYEITSATRPSELRFRTVAGAVRPQGYYRFVSQGEGTQVTFGLTCELQGLTKLMSPMVSKSLNGEVAALANLKLVMESGTQGPSTFLS